MVITLLQQDILWAMPEENRRRVDEVLEHLAPTDMFVVPETFTTGFGDHMAALAETPDGPTLQWARGLARRHSLLFVGTWVVREGDRCYNRLHWVFPDGTWGHYDKAHLFRVSGEATQLSPGTARPIFDYMGWRIRPAICYDLRFPTWLRNMPRPEPQPPLEYDLLLLCANWPAARREAWLTLLKARAIENLCYTVGCNRVGTDPHGTPYSGDSLCADYKGFPLASASSDPGTTSFTLHKEPLEAFRHKWPFYLDFN